jgi:transposase
MRKPIFVRTIQTSERQALLAGLRSSDAFTLRRCQILLASAAGQKALDIARSLHCDDQTVRNAIHDFNVHGLAALTPGSHSPHTIRVAFDAAAVEQLRALLHHSPRTFGHPTSLWTLELAAEEAFAQGLTRTRVTGETVRATLQRQGISWRRAKRWITSPDPEYARKKTLGTG